MTETNHFIWIKFYTAFADTLLKYRNDRKALIARLQDTYKNIGMKLPKLENGGFPTDIDPFTIYGLFNKGLTDENRKRIIQGLIAEFGIDAKAPNSFPGIPVLTNMMATFYQFDDARGEHDIDHLWDIFEAALALDSDDNPESREAFCSAFDQTLTQYAVKWNITMGLYWIRPHRFLNLDSRNRWFLSDPANIESGLATEFSKMKSVPSGLEYLDLCDRVIGILKDGSYSYKNFPELSYQAWIVSEDDNKREKKESEPAKPISKYGNSSDSASSDKIKYINPYSTMLLESRNVIFHGAPGTGKTYLAKQIAADIISGGQTNDITQLTDEQKKQVGFVQFHPSYDYTDFVEGMRPTVNSDGSMGFELQDGIFKSFVDQARKNYENSQKSKDSVEHELSAQEAMSGFFSDIEFGADLFKTLRGSKFYITGVDDKHIDISIPDNPTIKALRLNINELKRMLEADTDFKQIKDVASFFGTKYATQAYSYDFALYKAIKGQKKKVSHTTVKQESMKNYIFIIDEINRGEISKIFGELFFSIDPSYRGRSGEVSTQYSNMHADPDEKFYIPENVYIIGTMNDIDRSVDSFDFAMRRRFRFIELKADEQTEMLKALKDEDLENEALNRMKALNQEIAETEGLNENYQVGASYFLKLNTLDLDQLWTDYLCPLLQEYIRGMYDETEIMTRFEKAYKSGKVNPDETSADQG
jgi:hypothetical protein